MDENKSLVMLLVEDNPADVVLMNEALEATGMRASVHVAGDGERAMRFLRRQGECVSAPRPDVMVLDLNLPIKNGQQVLAEMSDDSSLRTIPVAILTTSSSEQHVCDKYAGRCAYFVKTDQFRQLQRIVELIAAHASPPGD